MIESYIIDLLRTHDCVIVPGFGGLLTHNQPAKILAQQREITPPKTGIIFNRSLDRNDGLLSHFVADKTNVTYRRAQAIIDESVNTWKKKLEEEKALEIEGIGSFSLNEENKWQFAPAETEIFFHDSYGLSNVELFAANKAERKTLKIASYDERDIKTRKINKGWIYGGLAAAAITIIAFFIAPQVQMVLHPSKNIASTAKIIPQITEAAQPLPANNTFLEAIATLPAKTEAITSTTGQPVTEPTNNQPSSDNTAHVNDSQGEYYIIGGSFLVHRNATKFARLLEKKGYKSHIIHNTNGFFNVSFVKEADTTSAVEQLNKLKIQENQQAWILKW